MREGFAKYAIVAIAAALCTIFGGPASAQVCRDWNRFAAFDEATISDVQGLSGRGRGPVCGEQLWPNAAHVGGC